MDLTKRIAPSGKATGAPEKEEDSESWMNPALKFPTKGSVVQPEGPSLYIVLWRSEASAGQIRGMTSM